MNETLSWHRIGPGQPAAGRASPRAKRAVGEAGGTPLSSVSTDDKRLKKCPECCGWDKEQSVLCCSFSYRANNRPCDQPLPLTPPLPIRRGGASAPVPLLLRHGTPAPCDSSPGSESDRRREETREILIHNNGATCSLCSISARSSLRSGAPSLRCTRTMPLIFSS